MQQDCDKPPTQQWAQALPGPHGDPGAFQYIPGEWSRYLRKVATKAKQAPPRRARVWLIREENGELLETQRCPQQLLGFAVDDVLTRELAVLFEFKLLLHGLLVLGSRIYRGCSVTVLIIANKFYEFSHVTSPGPSWEVLLRPSPKKLLALLSSPKAV